MTLRGVERVLRQFFDRLLSTTQKSSSKEDLDADDDDWFENAWLRIIQLCLDCGSLLGGREILDLRLVGVEVLVLCCQSSSQRGFIAIDARIGTNMQVVNGALRSVRPSLSTSSTTSPTTAAPTYSIHDDKNFALDKRRRDLFEKAFEVLIQFGYFLRETEEIIGGGNSTGGYVDSLHLQMLTKLSQRLSQLYVCCKDAELSPKIVENKREQDFVHLISLISMKMAHGGTTSKYLTQSQRECLDILKVMSLHGSSRAFEILATFGSSVILIKSKPGRHR